MEKKLETKKETIKLEDLSFQTMRDGTINVLHNGKIIASGSNKEALIQNVITKYAIR